MVNQFVLVVVVLLIVGFVVWAAENAPFVSDSVKPFIRWAAIVVGAIVVIRLLLNILGVDLGHL